MRTTVSILTLGAILAGCTWKPWKKDSPPPVRPDVEYVKSRPAVAVSPIASAAGAAKSRPTTQPRANRVAGVGRVVRRPETVAVAMIQVNDEFISLAQLVDPIRRELQAAAAGATEAQFRARAARLLEAEARSQIEQMLLLAEAKKRLLEWEKNGIEAEIARQYRQLLAQVNGSEKALSQRLRREGMDLDKWKQRLRRGLMIRTYVQRQLLSKIYVTRKMMWRYYETHPQEFRSLGRVQMQIISVPWRTFLPQGGRAVTEAQLLAARTKARQQIDKAAAALAKDGDFAEVARKFSTGPKASAGGVWPMMNLGSFRATQVEQAAYRQKVGQVSKIIEAPDGFYLVKTLASESGCQQAFETVQGRIEDKLTKQQYEQLTRGYLEELREKATIVVAENFQELSADCAVRQLYMR